MTWDSDKYSYIITCGVVANGMVASMMSEFELEGLSSKCLPENLMSHADAKHRLLAQDLLGILNSVWGSRRISLTTSSQCERMVTKVLHEILEISVETILTGPLLKKTPSGFILRTSAAG